MKISFSEYELRPRVGLRGDSSPRKGALLKFDWPEGVGFADLHPWTALGDPSFEECLQELREGEVYAPILSRSLEFSGIDALARAARKNLFEGLTIPESHWLATDALSLSADEVREVLARGFKRIKVKVGRDAKNEASHLRALSESVSSGEKLWRLDFNVSVSRGELETFLREMGAARPLIDFVEDPLPWDSEAWVSARTKFGVRFAADRVAADFDCVDLRVIKPAVEPVPSAACVVTSYLDHPFGQVCAAYSAAKAGVREICGLVSHLAYEPNAFAERLGDGPVLNVPQGTGFGFDDLLANQSWRALT